VERTGRHDDDGPVAQVADGRAEKGLLEPGARGGQDGQGAVRVVARPDAGQAAEGKAGEVRGPDGVAEAARRELPDPAGSAGQDVQSAVNVDDLDQLGGAEAVKQVRSAERGLARW
jgi:hypothetical protein